MNRTNLLRGAARLGCLALLAWGLTASLPTATAGERGQPAYNRAAQRPPPPPPVRRPPPPPKRHYPVVVHGWRTSCPNCGAVYSGSGDNMPYTIVCSTCFKFFRTEKPAWPLTEPYIIR